MKIPIAKCKHCGTLFVLDGGRHCYECYPDWVFQNKETPWEHIGWISEGVLVVCAEVAL